MTRLLATALLAGAAVLAVAAPITAPPPVDRPPVWASLSKAQQAALAPLQRDWASIEPARKQKWLEVATRFPTMPAAERERVQQRMSEWARMTPTERGQARLQFQESRAFTPADRQARWEEYKALPDDQRRELAQRAKPAAAASAPSLRSSESSAKRNTLQPAQQTNAKPVAPTLVQAKPGATTSLMSAKPAQTSHQQPGLPKIAATPGFVNPNTLLPRKGPQGAAVQTSAGSDTADQP